MFVVLLEVFEFDVLLVLALFVKFVVLLVVMLVVDVFVVFEDGMTGGADG
jgi:hypothetical protein